MKDTETADARPFYGWVIVTVATASLLISNGLAIGGLPVFYKPIQDDLLAAGAVTAQTKDAVTGLGAGLTFLLAGVVSLIAGLLVSRVGAKSLMVAGTVLLGSGLLVYSAAASPLAIYLAHSMLGSALGLVGVMIQTVLVSSWFQRGRGLAMGIVLTGTSLGGALIPFAATPLIGTVGWRSAMRVLSLLIWFVLLPATVFLVRERPASEPRSERAAGDGATFSKALRSPLFWIIAFCAALIFYPIFAVSQQFNLYLQNTVGVSREAASAAQSVLFVASIAGKFGFGWLCDRFATRSVIVACCGLMFVSTLMLLGFVSAATVYVFLIPFALGYGGTFVLIQLLTVEAFGLRDAAKILGAITLIETLGGFVGSVITGRLAAAYGGDYAAAFYGVTVASGLAFTATVVFWLLGRAAERRGAIQAAA